ncbi:MAG TPA: SDR family oxidoreductase [Candidatus Polarisedimenticolaceae bacterium]|nr:SDR family oxidoreductase [Candidatus Polarisedimenticolaceae bacterium]
MNATARPPAPLSLEGRTGIVSGGAGGIGSAVVRTLVGAGARVASVDLPGREAPAGATAIPCDLSDAAAIDRMFADFDGRFDRLDLLVHCAGVTRDAVLWKMSADDWSRVMRVNLDAAFHLLRGAAPRLRAAGRGAVVLISSINGERGKFGQANYAASKAGLIGLGRTAARELGRFGVRVNVVAPGWVETAMTAALPAEVKRQAIGESPLGRTATPEDVAAAVWFLCAEMSRHVTGQVLRVDGGQLMA